mgnify:FL=1
MGQVFSGCPGADRFKNPTITEKICPVCGNVIELFSVDTSVTCDQCGFVAYNDLQGCIQWCKYAEKCIGTEMYDKLVRKYKEEPHDTEDHTD